MERIAALVEGHTEAYFVKATYGNAIVQRPFPNGKSVTTPQIVDAINDALETLGKEIKRVVILLDREMRSETVEQMVSDLKSGLANQIAYRTIYIGVSDREIENWILADEEFVKQRLGQTEYKYAGDGTSGKGHLESICGRTLRGPRDKATMLKECSALRAKELSRSLKLFVASIDFDWYWATS